MSQPLLVTGTIGIDTILTPSGRADGVLGGSVSFAAVAALALADAAARQADGARLDAA